MGKIVKLQTGWFKHQDGHGDDLYLLRAKNENNGWTSIQVLIVAGSSYTPGEYKQRTRIEVLEGEGFFWINGQTLPYSPEKKLDVFINPGVKHCFHTVTMNTLFKRYIEPFKTFYRLALD